MLRNAVKSLFTEEVLQEKIIQPARGTTYDPGICRTDLEDEGRLMVDG